MEPDLFYGPGMAIHLNAGQRDTDGRMPAGRGLPRVHGHAVRAAARRAAAALALCAALCAAAGPLRGGAEPVFDWGFDLRLRQEYIRNGFDLSSARADDWNSIRVRSQLRGTLRPHEGWLLQAVLNNEHRHWLKSTRGYENEEFEINELVFENLFLRARRIGGTPLGFSAGRQNLFYGEGFVCWDGGPLDGSRTAYFNALLVQAQFGARSLDIHLLSNPRRDDYMPVINDLGQAMIEWDERGAGVYYSDDSFAGRRLEGYYFFKHERPGGGLPGGDIHALGARAAGAAFGEVTFGLEGAAQFGSRGTAERRACGGYLYAKWRAPLQRPLELSLGGIYLSGDDPDTEVYEGWNPLYARWPKWSELYIYTLVNERGVAYWENLSSGWFGVSAGHGERVSLDLKVYMLWAPEPPPDPSGPIFGGGGYRGTLSVLRCDWRLRKNLWGHLLWEVMRPGDFYAGASDSMHFLRWEVYFRR